MKRSIIIPKMLYSMCLAGTMFLAASISSSEAFQSNSEQTQRPNETRQGSQTFNDDDRKIISEAGQTNMNEIALAKMAQQKNVSQDVKRLARTVEQDHTQAMADLTDLAQSKNIPLDTPDTNVKSEEMTRFEKLDGEEFGKAYTELMTEKHEKAVKKFEKTAQDTQDPEIKAWANGQLSHHKEHLKGGKDSKGMSDKKTDSPNRLNDQNRRENQSPNRENEQNRRENQSPNRPTQQGENQPENQPRP